MEQQFEQNSADLNDRILNLRSFLKYIEQRYKTYSHIEHLVFYGRTDIDGLKKLGKDIADEMYYDSKEYQKLLEICPSVISKVPTEYKNLREKSQNLLNTVASLIIVNS